MEDFSASVDFLETLSYVDRNKIGAIGICGSGAFSLKAAQVDRRIKAVATTSMYAMKRGHHPSSRGAFTLTSSMAFMNFPLLNYIETMSPRPVLFIIGENAHSRYFSEDAYQMAAEPKELYIVPMARHIDLYDRTDRIPFDKLAEFFQEHLI